MKQYDKITPEGTKDLLFGECEVKKQVLSKISSIFESHGYESVMTPGIEFYDVFSANSRSYPQESMYKLVDLHGRLLVLRPDSTTPIARLVTTRLKGYTPPFRLYYNQNVYRLNKSLTGQSDEITQIGAELIGSCAKTGDLEIISMAIEALEAIGISDYRLEIGHIGFLNALIAGLPVTEEQKEEIRVLVNSKNYPALNDLLATLSLGSAINALQQLPRLFGGEEVFEAAGKLFDDTGTIETLNYLKMVYRQLRRLGLGDKLIMDLGLVNENVYYTGVIFRAYIEGSGQAVLSGGRYDKLFEDFGESYDATGFAIDADVLSKSLFSSGNHPKGKAPDILVTFPADREMDAVLYGKKLIQKGLKVELGFFEGEEDAIHYAKSKGILAIHKVSDSVQIFDINQ